MPLKHRPPVIRKQIEIVYIHPASRPKYTHTLCNVAVSLPFIEMHEDYGRVDEIDALRRYWRKIIAIQGNSPHVPEPFESAPQVPQHIFGNVGPDPLLTQGCHYRPNATDTCTDFQDDVIRPNTHGFL
jgi:hypothetical protein